MSIKQTILVRALPTQQDADELVRLISRRIRGRQGVLVTHAVRKGDLHHVVLRHTEELTRDGLLQIIEYAAGCHDTLMVVVEG